MHCVVALVLEHFASDVVERNIALEMILRVNHREDVSLRMRHRVHKFAHCVVDLDRNKVGLDQVVYLEKSKNGLVTVVCKEFSLLCNSFCIDRIRFN